MPKTNSPRWDPHYRGEPPTLFGFLPLYWPSHAAHHQLHCFFSLSLPSPCSHRDPPDAIFTGVSVTDWAHVRWCDHFCPWAATVMRLNKPVLLCTIFCTILCNCSDQSSPLPALVALRTIRPGTCRLSLSRSKVSSSLYGDSSVQRLPNFQCRGRVLQ